MHDQPHVRLVDSHAEGIGRDDRVQLVAHEAILHSAALVVVHAGMVGARAQAGRGQALGIGLGVLAGGGVDESATAISPADQTGQAGPLVGRSTHPMDQQTKIGASEAAHVKAGVTHAELVGDVAPHVRRGGRGQRDEAGRGQGGQDLAERAVGRAELVAPLGDAVRLVDAKSAMGRPERASAARKRRLANRSGAT